MTCEHHLEHPCFTLTYWLLRVFIIGLCKTEGLNIFCINTNRTDYTAGYLHTFKKTWIQEVAIKRSAQIQKSTLLIKWSYLPTSLFKLFPLVDMRHFIRAFQALQYFLKLFRESESDSESAVSKSGVFYIQLSYKWKISVKIFFNFTRSLMFTDCRLFYQA